MIKLRVWLLFFILFFSGFSVKNNTNFSFLIFNFSLLQKAFATTDEQAIQQQKILQQQQEQQRQFREQQQNINETRNIRDSRVRDGVIEDDGVKAKPIVVQNKCDREYNECIDKCNASYQVNMEQSSSGLANCVSQCAEARTDCMAELEATCPYRFNEIILKGNEIYSTRTLNKKIVNGFLNRCISKTNITELQSKLTNFYINNGYTMARVYFDMRHIKYEKVMNQKTGKEEIRTTFIVIIEEGMVNDIELEVQRKQKQTSKEKKLAKLFKKYKSLQMREREIENLAEGRANSLNKELELIKGQIKELEPQLESLALEVKEEGLKIQKKQPSKWTKARRSMQVAFAFPFRQERVFNMRDFEQGLDQMNRLQSNSITMAIEPTTDRGIYGAGYTDVIITNNQDPTKGGVPTGKRTTFLNLGINNSGNKNTGENVLNFSISQDNLISINDNIYISYTDSSFFNGNNRISNHSDPANRHPFRNSLDLFNNDNKKLRYSKSLYSSLSFPIGYWTINSNINYSTYKTTNTGQNTTFHTTGETLTQSYSLDRVIYRRQLYKLNIGTTLEVRDTESYIRDLKSDTGSKKTSNISLYLNNTIFTKYGTIIIKPSYQRGLSWFGSKMDEGVYGDEKFEKNEPRLQYDLIKLYAYYNTKINVPLFTKTQVKNPDGTAAKDENGKAIRVRNKLPIIYTLTMDSQYSFNTLYGKDQFSVGGEYTVRGFRESSIGGDNGFYFRNDLKVNLFHLLPDFITGSGNYRFNSKDNTKLSAANKFMNHNTIFLARESLNSILSKTYLSIFYDYGYVRNKYNSSLLEEYNARSGYLSGLGVGLSYNGNYLNWSLTYSKAIHSPNYLQTRDGIKKENHSFYWRVGVSW